MPTSNTIPQVDLNQPLAVRTFRSLIRAMGLMHRAMAPFFAGYGITASQWVVCRILLSHEEETAGALRLTDLGDRLLIRPPSVTGVVRRLQSEGYIKIGASDDDARVKRVRLTPKGRALTRRVRQAHAAQVQSVLGGLKEIEQAELLRLLVRLADAIEPKVSKHLEVGHA